MLTRFGSKDFGVADGILGRSENARVMIGRAVPGTSVVSGTGAGGSVPDRTKVRKSTPSTSSMVKNQLDPSAVSSWSATRLG